MRQIEVPPSRNRDEATAHYAIAIIQALNDLADEGCWVREDGSDVLDRLMQWLNDNYLAVPEGNWFSHCQDIGKAMFRHRLGGKVEDALWAVEAMATALGSAWEKRGCG